MSLKSDGGQERFALTPQFSPRRRTIHNPQRAREHPLAFTLRLREDLDGQGEDSNDQAGVGRGNCNAVRR
jgi:hypothetical protein